MTGLALCMLLKRMLDFGVISAAPNGGSARTSVDTVANGHLTDDAEGVTIFYGAGASGYLIVSSQGSNDYNVYHRDGDNKFIGKFADRTELGRASMARADTDGIDVTSASLGSAFPHGVFVAQDGKNTSPPRRAEFQAGAKWRGQEGISEIASAGKSCQKKGRYTIGWLRTGFIPPRAD